MSIKFPPNEKGKWLDLSYKDKIEWLNCACNLTFDNKDTEYEKNPGRTIEIDGRRIKDELSFYCEFGEAVNGPGGYFGRGQDGFDDCLFGGFGLDFPYKIIWNHCAISRNKLGNDFFEEVLAILNSVEERAMSNEKSKQKLVELELNE